MKILGIIPARYASTRFPGKPLADINGKPMIQHVYEKAAQKLDEVLVATDDERIVSCIKGFKGNVILTSDKHKTGTSRCIEAYEIYSKKTKNKYDVIINVQGDEPTLMPDQFDEIISCFYDKKTEIATLTKQTLDIEEILNPNIVKVVFDKDNFALYFSRSPIPFLRDKEKSLWAETGIFYKHVGIYAFKTGILKKLKKLEVSILDASESLEQLNWLYHGYNIKVQTTMFSNIGIDTPDDLEILKSRII